MNKAELVAAVADKVNLTKKVTEDTIDAMLDTICEVLASGDKVFISGFGTFEVRDRIARAGRNPRTGEVIDVPAKIHPKCKFGRSIKQLLNSN